MNIEKLKNKLNEDFYPITHAKAVIIDGETVDDAVNRINSSKYTKPSSGIPASDLSQSVQAYLSKADTAIVKPQGGSIGDVLTKTASGEEWQAPTGGSGAVSSVNGHTGAVVLSASDVGAGTYTKPSSGIPKTDLASAVRTSLGKADTAMQSPTGSAGQVMTKTASGYEWQNPETLLNLGGIEDTAGFIGAIETLTELPSYTAFIEGLAFTYYEPDYYGELQPVQADDFNQLVSYDYFEDEDGNTHDGIRLHSNGRFYYIDEEANTIRRLPTDYVTIEQGSSNGGKFLAVGQTGKVELVDAPSGGSEWTKLATFDLSTATEFTLNLSTPATEIAFVCNACKGSTATASAGRLIINDSLQVAQLIQYAKSGAVYYSKAKVQCVGGYIFAERGPVASAQTTAGFGNIAMNYANQSITGKITKIKIDQNPSYPWASGTVEVYAK